MNHPAVKLQDTTAGNRTEKSRIWRTRAYAWMAALLCAALPLAAQAQGASAAERVTRTITQTEKISFGTSYIDLPDVYRGYEKEVSEGVMGEREIQMQVVTEGNQIIKVILIKTVDKGEPVNQVVRRGTKTLRSETADGSRWTVSFIRPIDGGRISADYYDYPHHNGVDFAAPRGTPVYASAAGKVILAGWYGEYGRCVMLEHPDGSRTLYGHNSELTVSVGQKVKQGEKIAKVGSTGNSTGNHLHFELRVGNDYLDPLVYLEQ